MDTVNIPLSKTGGTANGSFTESKVVFFSCSGSRTTLSSHADTFENINYEIDKFLKEGWTPVNACLYNGSYTVLFCR